MCQEIFQGILPKLHRLINQMLNCLFRNTLFISDINRKSANKSHYIIIGSIRKYVNMWYLFMEKMTTTYSLEFFQAKLGVLQNLKPNAYILCSFLTQIESQLTPTFPQCKRYHKEVQTKISHTWTCSIALNTTTWNCTVTYAEKPEKDEDSLRSVKEILESQLKLSRTVREDKDLVCYSLSMERYGAGVHCWKIWL